MQLEFEPDFRLQLLRAQAEARGLSGRLQALARAREADGLDALEAETDAAESLGLATELCDALLAAAEPLCALGVERLLLDDAHVGMPTLRREGAVAQFIHAPAPVGPLGRALDELCAAFALDPERGVATLAVGLGGTGGCATGECLPEDAPPGPLFERARR